MAHAALLGEMVDLVDFHILGCNLPELTEVQAERLREVFVSHPEVSLGQVISAAWMSARDGAAALQANRGMPPWKATSHVVNKMATKLNVPANLPSYNIPGRYVPSGMVLVLVSEVLGLRLIEASLDEIDEPDEVSTPDVGDGSNQLDRAMSSMATFEDTRARVLRLLGDALDELQSGSPARTGATAEQLGAMHEASEFIAAAKATLDQAAS